jgi:lipoate---protein ligase
MRIIDLGTLTPEQSVAMDRAVFEARDSGRSGDTLHIYSRDRCSVSVGRFADIESEVDTALAEARGIGIVRRMSGGSAILTGPGQITYALTVGREGYDSREGSFAMICEALVASLEHLGVVAEYKEPNDILVEGRKISGSAQYRDRDALMQHGSLIISPVDTDALKVLKDIKPHSYDGLTSLEEILGYAPEQEEVLLSMMMGFSETLGTPIDFGELTEWEEQRAEEILRS